MNCKQCGTENNNGTKFCTRKCRFVWKKKHEIKGAKKRKPMYSGAEFDYEGDSV